MTYLDWLVYSFVTAAVVVAVVVALAAVTVTVAAVYDLLIR